MTDDREAFREKVIDKIRKLRAKGSNGAVTEEEANAFLDAAARLMAEHSVGDDDIARAGIAVQPIRKRGVHTSLQKMHPACTALSAIGLLTGTYIGLRVESSRRVDNGRLTEEVGFLSISGRPSDREVASYMFDQVRNLIDGAWRTERERRLEFLRIATGQRNVSSRFLLVVYGKVRKEMEEDGRGIGAKQRRSFGFGMARRLADRIEKMAVRGGDKANAMVVWQGVARPEGKPQKKLDLDLRAYSQGDAAGKQASLGQGVAAGQAAVLMIEEDAR